jgi:glycosyltransferase involved in cell wall biosynthesis
MINLGLLAIARQGHGGTLLYTYSMIEALRRLPAESYRLKLHVEEGNPEYDNLGLPIVRLPTPAAVFAAAAIGRTPFPGADVVIAPIYSTLLLAGHTPFAFTLHDLQEKYYPSHFGALTRLWRELSNRALLRRAGRVICESHFVKHDIVRFYGRDPATIDVVPAPPVGLLQGAAPSSPEDIAEVRARFGLPPVYALYPAQFWPHKNHLRLVSAFAKLVRSHPECHLVLTGKKRDEFDRVFRHVSELDLQSHVHHIGYVEQADLAKLYRGATLVVIPTLFESISIPVFEAFCAGTPICASRVVALPEQIGDAGLLFDPLDVDDIESQMGRLLQEPALREELAKRGRLRAAAVTTDNYAVQLRSLVDTLAALR